MTRQKLRVPQPDNWDGDGGGAVAVAEGEGQSRASPPDGPAVNEVQLRGRVSGEPAIRELPSGDVVVQLRVVVKRPPPKVRSAKQKVASGEDKVTSPSRVTVDTIDVACWTSPLRRAAVRCQDGDVVSVRGSLRRRFWRSGAGAASRYEVEASELIRDRRAAAEVSARR